ncbi:hypothetical protein PV516_01185 [Streptomyces scabiei]|uniref:hypothetical protein n=1 Tax=Streptomyces scabiei TaxID=1930 RepID=UPI0029A73541|nr:hypothetical protein [Streptomyces scabiei]MDX3162414.1 hypothetical protein [Streptomyces scabiei]
MAHRTDQPTPEPSPAERVAALHRAAAADYATRAKQADCRNQLAEARIHGNEAAGTR